MGVNTDQSAFIPEVAKICWMAEAGRHSVSQRQSIRQPPPLSSDVVTAHEASARACLRAMDAFRGYARLSTWLIRIVVNEADARMRKRSHSARVIQLSGDTGHDEAIVEAQMDESTFPLPEQAALRAGRSRCARGRMRWRRKKAAPPSPRMQAC